MPSNLKLVEGPVVTLLTTECDALPASGGVSAAGVAFDNAANGYPYAEFELYLPAGVAFTAGQAFELYEVPSLDGALYADHAAGASGTGFVNGQRRVCGFTPRAGAAEQRIASEAPVRLRPGKTRYALVNRTSVAGPASGVVVRMRPHTEAA